MPAVTRKSQDEEGNVVDVVVRAASVRLGVRSMLAARGAAASPSADAAPKPVLDG
jgi:hypothetical protein